MVIDQREYEKLKRQVSGLYHKFNTDVLKWNMSKMFHYETLLETAKNFENFEDYYNFHTKGKKEIMLEIVNRMYEDNKDNYSNLTIDKVANCVTVRLGNVYNGMYTEEKILNTFNNLTPWITCKKTEKEIDTNYKVDGIITLAGIGQIGIQIKPVSFTKYDEGSELSAHKQFEIEYGTKVYYVFYKDRFNIIFNGDFFMLDETDRLITNIEKLVYSM